TVSWVLAAALQFSHLPTALGSVRLTLQEVVEGPADARGGDPPLPAGGPLADGDGAGGPALAVGGGAGPRTGLRFPPIPPAVPAGRSPLSRHRRLSDAVSARGKGPRPSRACRRASPGAGRPPSPARSAGGTSARSATHRRPDPRYRPHTRTPGSRGRPRPR